MALFAARRDLLVARVFFLTLLASPDAYFMKKHLLSPLFALLTLGAMAQKPVSLNLPLRAVTLYPGSGELYHRGEIALPAGPTEVLLTGLSPRLLGPSVQPEVSGAELDGVDVVASARPLPGTVSGTLSDSLRMTKETIRQLLNEQTADTAEKAFLEQNKQVGLATKPKSWLTDVQRGAAYYRTRLAALAQREAEIAELLPIQQQLALVLGQRAGLLPVAPTKSQTVVLHLNLAQAGTVRIDLSYQLGNADAATGWTPEYELRVSETNLRQLRVVSRARLRNFSGVAWANVPVLLRTTTPSAGTSQPRLDPWGIRFEGDEDDYESRKDKKMLMEISAAPQADMAVAEPVAAPKTDIPGLGVRISLPEPVTLGLNAAQTFRLAEQTLPMRLEYLAVPKLEEEVFLVGRVADWNQVHFMTKTAKVFFRGGYVGEKTFDTRGSTDTLEVALGRDPEVQLTRVKRDDFEALTGGSRLKPLVAVGRGVVLAVPATIGNRTKTRLAYEITVKNTHAYPVRLRLLDQIPVSQEREVTVKVLNIGGAALETASGKLTWLVTVPSGSSRRFPVAFSVEAPTNRPINLGRDRSIE